jgi:hypothetical protein
LLAGKRGRGGDVREQQSPRPLPGQVYPSAPPQVPSGETLSVDVGAGGAVEVNEGTTQSPKPGWQPSVVRQWPSVEPHQP